jgi:O-antigen/teichoic acid export membrane protein
MKHRLNQLMEKARRSEIAKGTLWMGISSGLRLAIQAAYFILVTRLLGAEQYGQFASIASLVAIAFPFSGLGTGEIMLRNVARNPRLFSQAWGYALSTTALSSFVITGFLIVISRPLLPHSSSISAICALAISDLFCFRVVSISWQAFMAFSRMRETAYLNLVPSVLRLIAALALSVLFAHPNLEQWSYLYLIASIASAGVGVAVVWREFGTPNFSRLILGSELWEGFHFSIGLSAQSIYNDIDKILLSRLATLEVTGIYAAAYRIIDVSFVPVRSLLAATFSKFFQHGANGIVGSLAFAKKVIPTAIIMGIVSSLSLLAVSSAVPYVLGKEYEATAIVIRWLCLLPMIKSIHYFGADILTGANFQGIRSLIQIGIAVLNLILNLWLIPFYTWQGAAIVSLISDGLLLISLWMAVGFLHNRQIRQKNGF